MPSLRVFVSRVVDVGPFPTRLAMVYRLIVAGCVLLATGVGISRTIDGLAWPKGIAANALEAAAQLALTLDLVLQAADAVLSRRSGTGRWSALRRYLGSPYGVIDVVAVVPYFVELALPAPADLDTVLAVVRFLKLARYSPALETLGSVVRREFRPLQSAAFILALLMLCSATMLYLVERHRNPHFTSIPDTMWWSVATLTTVGYGDAVPITGLGKLLGGLVAVFGIAMFALPASILATGFAEELKRRDFLQTWHMVAKVPFFSGLDAQQIASISALLRYHVAQSGDVLIRAGDLGDRMYFVVTGLAEADFGGREPAVLGEGDFFGEIALLHDSPRTATVTARSRCQLLVLDVKDFRRFIAGSPQIGDMIEQTARRRLNAQAEMVDSLL